MSNTFYCNISYHQDEGNTKAILRQVILSIPALTARFPLALHFARLYLIDSVCIFVFFFCFLLLYTPATKHEQCRCCTLLRIVEDLFSQSFSSLLSLFFYRKRRCDSSSWRQPLGKYKGPRVRLIPPLWLDGTREGNERMHYYYGAVPEREKKIDSPAESEQSGTPERKEGASSRNGQVKHLACMLHQLSRRPRSTNISASLSQLRCK